MRLQIFFEDCICPDTPKFKYDNPKEMFHDTGYNPTIKRIANSFWGVSFKIKELINESIEDINVVFKSCSNIKKASIVLSRDFQLPEAVKKLIINRRDNGKSYICEINPDNVTKVTQLIKNNND